MLRCSVPAAVMAAILEGASALASGSVSPAPPAQESGRLATVVVHSPALEGNLLGDPIDQQVAVYVPPGYVSSGARRYPALYVLHGFNDTFQAWAQGMAGAMDALIGLGRAAEMLVVVPNGRNAYVSSYFSPSPTTGDWETFLVQDVVGYVDAHYRTIASPSGRALVGHSKGGFAALRISMLRPGVFGIVHAMSPCCLSLEAAVGAAAPEVWRRIEVIRSRAELDAYIKEMDEAEGMSDAGFLVGITALAAAFSPNPSRPPLFVDLPFRVEEGGLRADAPVLERWRRESPVNLVEAHAAALRQLRGLYIDYGYRDVFPDIPVQARALSERLGAAGVPHVLEAYDGGHEDRLRERLPAVVLPFVSRLLDGQ